MNVCLDASGQSCFFELLTLMLARRLAPRQTSTFHIVSHEKTLPFYLTVDWNGCYNQRHE